MESTHSHFESDISNLPDAQQWMIGVFRVLGYSLDREGICVGTSSKGVEAMVIPGGLSAFDRRLNIIFEMWQSLSNAINLKDMKNDVNNIERLIELNAVQVFEEAKQATLNRAEKENIFKEESFDKNKPTEKQKALLDKEIIRLILRKLNTWEKPDQFKAEDYIILEKLAKLQKIINLHQDAKSKALQEIKLLYPKMDENNLTAEQKKLLNNTTEKYVNEKLILLSPKEQEIYARSLELLAYADAIKIYQTPREVPELFEEKIVGQDLLKSSQLVMSLAIEKQGGLKIVDQFTGIYKNDELIFFFESLRKKIEEFNLPAETFSVTLNSYGHIINFGYDPKKSEWLMIDANHLSKRNLPNDKVTTENKNESISTFVHKAFFSKNENNAFQTTVYTTKANHEKVSNVIKAWKIEIEKLHKISASNVNSATSDGISWLMIAARRDDYTRMQELLDKGSNPNQISEDDGSTPLHNTIMVQTQNLEIIKLLLDKGADPALCDHKGSSPLFLAVQTNNKELVKLLLQKIKDPADLDPRYHGNKELYLNAQLRPDLFKKKFDDFKSICQTPLHYAIREGLIEIVKVLLEDPNKKPDVNATFSIHVSTLTEYAKKQNRNEFLTKLLETKRTNITRMPVVLPAFTALHLSICLGQTEIVKLLLQNGADLNKKSMNISVFEMAEAMGNQEILDLLNEYKNKQNNVIINQPERSTTAVVSKGLDLTPSSMVTPQQPDEKNQIPKKIEESDKKSNLHPDHSSAINQTPLKKK